MRKKFWDRLLPKKKPRISFLKGIVSGSLYHVSDMKRDSSVSDIRNKIEIMRQLANDSQISTALSYYATDATITNTEGQIIWATPISKEYKDIADVVNELFVRWDINKYARDHILELATIGNLYIPTTELYREDASKFSARGVVLDNNTIIDTEYDIVPSTKLPPENVLHLWYHGEPQGYIYQPDESESKIINCPESAIIHFSLGGLLGDYTIDAVSESNEPVTYDIQFATPLMEKAIQPTQTLNLLEDAQVLSSLSRVIKFVNVECSDSEDETEIADDLQQIKDKIEQQLSLNTLTGDAQSYVNPQSPNNLVYLPRINGQDAISITDLNMAESTDQDNEILTYYQDKKLSVLGVPKEALNFSSNEGLGGAGSVLSQRSAIYANSLQRLETAYISGWTDALNKYFVAKNLSGFVGKFKLHMTPIITTQSTITFEKRDSAVSQASAIVELMKSLGVDNASYYQDALSEILLEALPRTGSDAKSWNLNLSDGGEGDNDF